MTCRVCRGHGFYSTSKDPDMEDICECPSGDAHRTPGERALRELMRAFDKERTR